MRRNAPDRTGHPFGVPDQDFNIVQCADHDEWLQVAVAES